MSKDIGEQGPALKNLGTRNFVVDLLLLADLALISGIGVLMKVALPPGRVRILKYSDNRDLFFLGLDRHQWGTVHLVASGVMLALLILHLVFHWKTFECLVRNAIPRRPLRRALAALFALICAGMFAFGFIIRPEPGDEEVFLHRNVRAGLAGDFQLAEKPPRNAEIPERTKDGETPPPSGNATIDPNAGRTGSELPHADDHRLFGNMTLNEAARLFGIPAAEAKRRLGLPGAVSDSETMGRIRRLYGFTMYEAEERLKGNR